MSSLPYPSGAGVASTGSRSNGPVVLPDLIGGTPLIDLSALSPSRDVALYAKAELANPGGSVKDRPARAMILDAIARGELTRERRILDATSGNTGIAIAMLGAAMGYGVTLCLPQNASPERKKILAAFGAELVITSALEGSDGAIREARRLAVEGPDLYCYLDQYSNDQNWQAHYRTTGPEIWEQTGGAVTHFVTGLGTSGTFVGTGRFLRERNPEIRLISFEPDSPFHGLEGMKHMESAIVPPIYDSSLADENRACSTERAYRQVRELARDAGLLVGISSGANVSMALEVAAELDHGTVVTILCDGADKYLSASFWEERT
ncbi:MAG TPA: cysteine synthase family protein [Thermoanaerobaculia bacterium]|nr:cysteine synthase family protein [Thermoanaerobaculia bacterium]